MKGKIFAGLIIILLGLGLGYFTTSCTQNARVKLFGGTGEITLPKGEKLVHVTWKDSDLWYLTRPMGKADSAVTYRFQEKSSFGMVEGTYVIHEVK